MTQPEKYLVFSDLHGRTELLDEIVKTYQEQDVEFVSNGDLIGGPDTRGSVQRVLDLGITAVYGNHEWAVDTVLNIEDEEVLEDLAVVGHRRYFGSIYPSYGITGLPDSLSNNVARDAILELKSAIKSEGHEEFFSRLHLYFQTGSFVAVHAGVLPNKPWFGDSPAMSQKAELDEIGAKINSGEFDWTDGPPIQIADNSTYSLSRSNLRPAHLREMTLVTGHWHTNHDEYSRTSARGKRVSLGDGKSPEGPIYVWESWNNQVVPILVK